MGCDDIHHAHFMLFNSELWADELAVKKQQRADGTDNNQGWRSI